MSLLIIWGFFGIIAAVIAGAKGRSGFGWFILGMLLGPFALVVALLPSRNLQSPMTASMPAADLVPCPECAEMIQRQAKKCRFCGAPVTPPPEPRELRCFHCAHMNKNSAIACEKCGQKIQSLVLG